MGLWENGMRGSVQPVVPFSEVYREQDYVSVFHASADAFMI